MSSRFTINILNFGEWSMDYNMFNCQGMKTARSRLHSLLIVVLGITPVDGTVAEIERVACDKASDAFG